MTDYVPGPADDPRDEVIRRLRVALQFDAPYSVAHALNTLANELQWSIGAVGGGWGALVAEALLDEPESLADPDDHADGPAASMRRFAASTLGEDTPDADTR